MKTLQELYDEVIASEELRTEFLECSKTEETAQGFLKKYDCPSSVDELKEFLNEKMITDSQQLNEEQLKLIAGGDKTSKVVSNVVVTLLAFGGCVTQSLYVGTLNSPDCFLS